MVEVSIRDRVDPFECSERMRSAARGLLAGDGQPVLDFPGIARLAVDGVDRVGDTPGHLRAFLRRDEARSLAQAFGLPGDEALLHAPLHVLVALGPKNDRRVGPPHEFLVLKMVPAWEPLFA